MAASWTIGLRRGSAVCLRVLLIATLVAGNLVILLPAPSYAAPRPALTAGTVTDCAGDQDFVAKLAGGGTVDFACGAATITLGAEQAISVDTVVDGGGQITLSGGDVRRLFSVSGGATLTLRNLTIVDGYADFDGGAIFANLGSGLVIENVTMRSNRTTLNGSGGALISYGTVTIRNSRFEDNEGANGGAVYARWGGGVVTIEDTVFLNNKTLSPVNGWGGAILTWDGATFTITRSRFEGNTAQSGGAIYNTANSTLTLHDSVMTGNRADYSGGALYNQATATLRGVDVLANDAELYGGGITNAGGTLEVIASRINDNVTGNDDSEGGGLYTASRNDVPSSVRLIRSEVMRNSALSGGGISSNDDSDEIEIIASTIAGNSAEDGGGIEQTGSVYVINSTLSGNIATVQGAAIYQAGGGVLDVQFSTIANHSGVSIHRAGFATGATSWRGALVAGSCNVAQTSNGYNLETSASCGFNQGTDLVNTDPQVGALGSNGGPTLTHLPAAGSPALNGGGPACPMTDQRGFFRPAAGACDIGAVEGGNPPPLSVTPTLTPSLDLPAPLIPDPAVTPQPPGDAPPIVHSQVPNGIAPTISLSPQQGAPGDTIRVSGQSVPGYGTVRVVSMLDGRTQGSVTAAAAANGAYSFQFTIPPGTRPGPIELCATVVGAENAQFACAPLTVNAPPPVTLQGTLPAEVNASNATVRLTDGAGRTVYSAAVNAAGNYNLGNVTPGVYRYNVVGQVNRAVLGGVATVGAGSRLDFSVGAQINTCLSIAALTSTGSVSASPARSGVAAQQRAVGNIVGTPLRSALGGGAPVFDARSRAIGIYVSGVRNDVTFEAFPQASGPLQGVILEFLNADSSLVHRVVDNTAPYRAVFDVGRLAPSRGTRHPMIKVIPVVNGSEECPYYIDIEVIANPFQRAGVQPNALVWDGGKGVYAIQGIVPHIPGILPTDFQFPPPPAPALPFLGRYNNRLNAGIQVVGTLNLEGYAHLQAIRTVTHVFLMNRELLPPGFGVTLLRPNLKLPITNLREASFPIGPYPLVPDVYLPTPFLEVPVISFFGLIDVTVNASAGIGAGVSIGGYIKPLKPEVAATLTGTGRAHAELGVGVRLLAGLARAGATARLDAELAVPLTVELIPAPDVTLDACLTMRFAVRAYASAGWGLVSKDTTREIAKWTGCVSELAAAQINEADPTTPDVLAEPVVAIGSNGVHVTAYVENTAAANATPQVQVLARLKASDGAAWDAPVALSNPLYSASNPVVALVGPEQWPLVAWVEKPLTAAEAAALGNDLNALLQSQEIVYRLYRNGVWEEAVYLTDDDLGDGLPALAGGAGGAVLAWTRDQDGAFTTRADQRIAVTIFDPTSATFAPFRLLDATDGAQVGAAQAHVGGLNGDVQVAWDAANQRPYVVWVYDGDANLQSADDRRLALAFWDEVDWVLLNPQPLPPRVDSPALTVGPDGVQLAFLVRDVDTGGSVGLLGTNGVLWAARLVNGLWQAAPVRDGNGRAIFAEQPVLAGNGPESLLLYRRFGERDDNSQFGQLAVSQLLNHGAPSRPIYLTDEARQNWQGSLAVNPATGLASIVKVSRVALVDPAAAAVEEQVAIAATEAVAAPDQALLSTADDPVTTLTLGTAADPALDPLQVSALAPAPNTPVQIRVVVRNVGRGQSTGVRVRLFTGTPQAGTPAGPLTNVPDLGFSETATVTLTLNASGAEQPIYVQLTTSGSDASTANNRATLVLGRLSAPVMAHVEESAVWIDGLEVGWAAASNEYVQGFRILRGTQTTGPFDLMGEASVPGYTDVPLARGQTYCYAVEAYNANTISPRSAAVCGMLRLNQLYLPSLRKP